MRGGLERRARAIVTWATARGRDFRRRLFPFRLLAAAVPSPPGRCAPRPRRGPRRRARPAAAVAMKKFFQEIKSDIKFKSAGPGQKLTESVGCATGAAAGSRGWGGPRGGAGGRDGGRGSGSR